MSYGAPVISNEEIIAGLQKKVEKLEANCVSHCAEIVKRGERIEELKQHVMQLEVDKDKLLTEWGESQSIMVAQVKRLTEQVTQFKSGHKEYE